MHSSIWLTAVVALVEKSTTQMLLPFSMPEPERERSISDLLQANSQRHGMAKQSLPLTLRLLGYLNVVAGNV